MALGQDLAELGRVRAPRRRRARRSSERSSPRSSSTSSATARDDRSLARRRPHPPDGEAESRRPDAMDHRHGSGRSCSRPGAPDARPDDRRGAQSIRQVDQPREQLDAGASAPCAISTTSPFIVKASVPNAARRHSTRRPHPRRQHVHRASPDRRTALFRRANTARARPGSSSMPILSARVRRQADTRRSRRPPPDERQQNLLDLSMA